jgi:hypothetical protein
MQVFLHKQKSQQGRPLTECVRCNQTTFPEGKNVREVKRRKEEIFLDNFGKRERSLIPLVLITVALWLAVLTVATWFSR